MRLVIQMKTDDDMQLVKQWVINSFTNIKNQRLGIQDFSINPKTKKPNGLPYKEQLDEIVVFNSVKDQYVLYLYFTFDACKEDYHR